MGKQRIYNCAYLEVEIDGRYWLKTEKDWQGAADSLADEIKRHCDNVGRIEVHHDVDFVCEHCGMQWTEGDSPHNGGCCDADCVVMEAADAAEGDSS